MITTRHVLFGLTATAVLVFAWLFASRVASNPQPAKSAAHASVTKPAASSDASTAALAKEIDRTIDESDSAHARWGVLVVSLKDGRVLYTRDGDKLFMPASNMKIFT